MESAEISKRTNNDANRYESKKNQVTVAVIDTIDAKYDLVSEAVVI